ncbi:unnamed protein product [Toxocara canis]|uniref:Alpha-galactosidase n=1 Tax=Toxocara canis TaxID=6265 RepID=A0A183V3S2_TOXCA|nr:unnamed protein product [Toxocara canis]
MEYAQENRMNIGLCKTKCDIFSYVVGDRYRAHKSLKWDWEKFVASNKLDPKFRGIFRYANTTRSDLPLPQRHIYVPVTPIAANRSISLLLNHGEGLHDKIRIAHGTTAIIRRDRQKKDVELSLNERSAKLSWIFIDQQELWILFYSKT